MIDSGNKDKTLFANFGYMEPEMIFIEIAAIIFEIDIELFIFDGVLDGENNIDDFNFGKLNFKGRTKEKEEESEVEEIPGKIKLIFNLDSYSLFYRYQEIISFKDILKDFVIEKDYDYIKIDEYDFCELCRNKECYSKKKILFHEKKVFCCYDCLRDNSLIILKERLKSYLKDGCLSRECNNKHKFINILSRLLP